MVLWMGYRRDRQMLSFEDVFKASGLGQRELARQSGLNQARISRLIAGKTELREPDILALAPALKVAPDALELVRLVDGFRRRVESGDIDPGRLATALKSARRAGAAGELEAELLDGLERVAAAAEKLESRDRMAGLGRDAQGRRLRGRAAQRADDELALSEKAEYDADARSQFLGRDSTGRRRRSRERRP